jgi:hypothetical protein
MFPLSAAQLGIWFAQQINPSSPAYNIGEYIEICGSVDPILFEQALQRVITEAEALRLKIIDHVDGPRQIIAPPSAWSMPIIDVSAEPDRLIQLMAPCSGSLCSKSRPVVSFGTRAITTLLWTRSVCG